MHLPYLSLKHFACFSSSWCLQPWCQLHFLPLQTWDIKCKIEVEMANMNMWTQKTCLYVLNGWFKIFLSVRISFCFVTKLIRLCVFSCLVVSEFYCIKPAASCISLMHARELLPLFNCQCVPLQINWSYYSSFSLSNNAEMFQLLDSIFQKLPQWLS